MFFIYSIIHPKSTIVVYVGQTADPNRRYYQHVKRFGISCIGKTRHCFNRAMPKIKILETCETKEAATASESKWIKHYLKRGHPLKNIKHTKNLKSSGKTQKAVA